MEYLRFPIVINSPASVAPTRLDKVEKATTDGGYVQTRLKSSRAMYKYVVSWDALPHEQLKVLVAFDEQTGYGSKPFWWQMPDRWEEPKAKLVRIAGELSLARQGRRHYSVKLNLEEV